MKPKPGKERELPSATLDIQASLGQLVQELYSVDPGLLHCRALSEIRLLQVSHHPNSVIARILVRDGSEEKRFLAKVLYPDKTDGRVNRSDHAYKLEQVNNEFIILKLLHHSLPRDLDVGVVEPVTVFPELYALLMVEHQGEVLTSYLNKIRRFAPRREKELLCRYVNRIGDWLRRFQEVTATSDDWKDFAEFVEYCELRLARLSRCRPGDFPPSFTADIIAWLAKSFEAVASVRIPAVGRHNDFTPNNILVSGDRLLVFDFAGFSYGPASVDPVRFWSLLEAFRGSPLIRSAEVDSLLRAFETGYGRRIDFEDRMDRIFRVACMVDKLDDLWCWNQGDIGLLRYPIYERLNRRLLRWLHDTLRN